MLWNESNSNESAPSQAGSNASASMDSGYVFSNTSFQLTFEQLRSLANTSTFILANTEYSECACTKYRKITFSTVHMHLYGIRYTYDNFYRKQ